jgi:uncharacterized paraquat-inducible protein A
MSDEHIITSSDGSKWRPSTSVDRIQCASCDNLVDTPAEIASYPSGQCPQCNNPWTGAESRHTQVTVTAPEAIRGEA